MAELSSIIKMNIAHYEALLKLRSAAPNFNMIERLLVEARVALAETQEVQRRID